MKPAQRLLSLVTLVLGMHVLTIWVQPIVHSGSGNGGQACADDDTDVDCDEY